MPANNRKRDKLSKVTFSKTRELTQLINLLKNTTVGNLATKVNTLQNTVDTQVSEIQELKNEVNILRTNMNKVLQHTHKYNDDNGTETIEKTTGENLWI